MVRKMTLPATPTVPALILPTDPSNQLALVLAEYIVAYLPQSSSVATQQINMAYWLTIMDVLAPYLLSGEVFIAAGDLTGTNINQTVIGLQTIPLSSSAPTLAQVLTYNGSEWIAEDVPYPTPPTSFSAGGDLTGTISAQYVQSLSGANDAGGAVTLATNAYLSSANNQTVIKIGGDTFLTSDASNNIFLESGGSITIESTTDTTIDAVGGAVNLTSATGHNITLTSGDNITIAVPSGGSGTISVNSSPVIEWTGSAVELGVPLQGIPSNNTFSWGVNTIALGSGGVNTLTTANSYGRILKFTGALVGSGTILELLDVTTDWVLDFTAMTFGIDFIPYWSILVEMGLGGKTFTVNSPSVYYVYANSAGSGYLYYVLMS